MQHSFDIRIAEKYGVHAAVILNNIYFWIEKNRANEKNMYDGHVWTYNSMSAFQELFPYLSKNQIEYALKKLIDGGILITGNYNKSPYDRTLWYAITEIGYSILENSEMGDEKFVNGNNEIPTPIPNIKQDIKKSNNKTNINNIISEMVDDEDIKEVINDFIEMRKAMKKPMTVRAVKMLISRLNRLSEDKETQIKILEQSILHNWLDVYELKEDKKGGRHGGNSGTRDGSEYAEFD